MQRRLLKFALVLSFFAGVIPLICQKAFFPKSEVDLTLPENWKRMSTQERLDRLDGILSKNEPFFLLSRIRQLTVRSYLRKMIVSKKDETLKDGFRYSLRFYYDIGWLESGLLGLAGFTSIWIVYGFFKVTSPFLRRLPVTGFPSRWSRRAESLPLPASCELTDPSRIGLPVSGLLTIDEGPKRPRKPRAAWID